MKNIYYDQPTPKTQKGHGTEKQKTIILLIDKESIIELLLPFRRYFANVHVELDVLKQSFDQTGDNYWCRFELEGFCGFIQHTAAV